MTRFETIEKSYHHTYQLLNLRFENFEFEVLMHHLFLCFISYYTMKHITSFMSYDLMHSI